MGTLRKVGESRSSSGYLLGYRFIGKGGKKREKSSAFEGKNDPCILGKELCILRHPSTLMRTPISVVDGGNDLSDPDR